MRLISKVQRRCPHAGNVPGRVDSEIFGKIKILTNPLAARSGRSPKHWHRISSPALAPRSYQGGGEVGLLITVGRLSSRCVCWLAGRLGRRRARLAVCGVGRHAYLV